MFHIKKYDALDRSAIDSLSALFKFYFHLFYLQKTSKYKTLKSVIQFTVFELTQNWNSCNVIQISMSFSKYQRIRVLANILPSNPIMAFVPKIESYLSLKYCSIYQSVPIFWLSWEKVEMKTVNITFKHHLTQISLQPNNWLTLIITCSVTYK